ncbi:MAG TPA: hypothetical protein PKA60_00770 [Candidatus Paceibacterota bacterium]|nr:hypothetical protein [Candidatus Paceibacterota bacterium]
MKGPEKMKAHMFEDDLAIYKKIAEEMVRQDKKISDTPDGLKVIRDKSQEYEDRKNLPDAVIRSFDCCGEIFHVALY